MEQIRQYDSNTKIKNPKLGSSVPMEYYLNFSQLCSKEFSIALWLDQASQKAITLVKKIMERKDIYKFKAKSVCLNIYNPNGTATRPGDKSFMGWARRIQCQLESNMSREDWEKFSIASGVMDDEIEADLFRQYNACLIKVGQRVKRDQKLFSDVVSTMMFCWMCAGLIQKANSHDNGDITTLCIDDSDPIKRNNGLRLIGNDLETIASEFGKLFYLVSGIPEKVKEYYSNEMSLSIDILAQKMMTSKLAFKAAEEAGVDLRKTTRPEFTPEALEAQRERVRQENLEKIDKADIRRHKRERRQQQEEEKLNDLAEAWGTNIKAI